MTYKLNYNLLSIHYSEADRKTTVSIVNEDTGEIFTGTAQRNPADRMNIRIGTNLALARALRLATATDLSDDITSIMDYETSFNCDL